MPICTNYRRLHSKQSNVTPSINHLHMSGTAVTPALLRETLFPHSSACCLYTLPSTTLFPLYKYLPDEFWSTQPTKHPYSLKHNHPSIKLINTI